MEDKLRVCLPSEDELKKIIQCPICLDILKPPIYTCTQGHCVCPTCRTKMHNDDCPQCFQPFTQARNFVAEELANLCVTKCRNVDHGCNLEIKLGQMDFHRLRCDYRPVDCVDCDEKIYFGYYLEHQKEMHDMIGVNDECGVFTFNLLSLTNGSNGSRRYLKCFDEKIIFFNVRNFEDNIIAYASFFGKNDEACNFRCKIEIYTGEVSQSWIGPLSHFRETTPASVFNNNLGLIIPVKPLVATAKEDDDWITYEVVISSNFGGPPSAKRLRAESNGDIPIGNNFFISVELYEELKVQTIPYTFIQKLFIKGNLFTLEELANSSFRGGKRNNTQRDALDQSKVEAALGKKTLKKLICTNGKMLVSVIASDFDETQFVE